MKYLYNLCLLLLCLLSGETFGQSDIQYSEGPAELILEKQKIDSLDKLIIDSYFEKDYGRTIDLAKDAIARAKAIDYREQIFVINSYLGNAFLAIQDTLQAKRTFSETLQLAEQIQDTSALIINSIDLGNVHLLQKQTQKAIALYKSTIPIAAKRLSNATLDKTQYRGLRDNLFVLNYNLAEIYLNDKDIVNARRFVRNTREFYNDSLFIGYKAAYHFNEGRLLSLENTPTQALEKYKMGESLASSIGFTDLLIDIAEARIEDEKALGELQEVIKLYDEVDSLKSEKYKSDRIIEVENATARFKLDQYKKDLKSQELQSEIDQQNAKNETKQFWIIIALVISIVASIILFIFDVKRRSLLKNLRRKNKQYLSEKEKTEALSHAKTVLFSNIAHELRTPTYGIVGLSNAIQRPEEKNNFDQNIKTLQYSAQYLMSLINNILLFNESNVADDDELDIYTFELSSVLQNAVESSKNLNELEPNQYQINIDPSIPQRLRGDKIKLFQILINLISNTTKFTSVGIINISAVLLEKTAAHCRVKFIIKDIENSINTDLIPHFLQEHTTLPENQNFSNYGLGLPIVRKLLKMHGSKLELSTATNEATEISFTLNYEIAPTDTPSIDDATTSDLAKNPFRNYKFLVVDDNRINLLVTQKTLSNLGGEVHLASSGEEGIEKSKIEAFDLIFMDINMPKIDGFLASERIRLFNKHVPIIALTAVDLHTISKRNREGLINGFLIKPYKTEKLISTVEKFLSMVQRQV